MTADYVFPVGSEYIMFEIYATVGKLYPGRTDNDII